jgi:hypothetical protein
VEQEAERPNQPAQEPVASIDVDRLAGQIQQLASNWNLRIVPATPVSTVGSCQLVLLGNDDFSAADFCELAASAGARLLYVQAEFFYAGTDPVVDLGRRTCAHPGSPDDQLAKLHQDAQRFNGRVRQLELAFAVGCVMHCWAVAADWYTSLVDRAAAVFPYPPGSSDR